MDTSAPAERASMKDLVPLLRRHFVCAHMWFLGCARSSCKSCREVQHSNEESGGFLLVECFQEQKRHTWQTPSTHTNDTLQACHLAIVPRLLTRSAFVMPMPVSMTDRVLSSLFGTMRMFRLGLLHGDMAVVFLSVWFGTSNTSKGFGVEVRARQDPSAYQHHHCFHSSKLDHAE